MGPPREPKISKKHWRVVQKSTFPAFRFEAPLVPLRDPFSAHFGAPNGLQNGPESTPKITSKFVPSKDAQIGLRRPSKGPQVGPQIGPKSASDPSRAPSGHHETPNPAPGALRTPSWTPPGPPPGPPRDPPGAPPGAPRDLFGTPLDTARGAHGSLPRDPSGDRLSWVWAGGIREAIRSLVFGPVLKDSPPAPLPGGVIAPG